MFRSRPSTRRRLITGAARLAALSSAATLMPPHVRKLMAQTPKRAGSLKDIKHVVLLMQENRSFDHYFGTLAGVRGFNDPNALTLKNGKSVFYQPDPENYHSGYLLPFHLDTKTTNAQKLPSTSHAWNVQHIAWNGGRMDQWLLAHRLVDKENAPYVMGYFKREDIPFHYALADAFTICDGYHCSVLGPTGPNRLYYMTGMIDPDGTSGGPSTSNIRPQEGFAWKTYPERLEEAGVSWRVYQCGKHGRPFNQLQHFRQFMDAPHNSACTVKVCQNRLKVSSNMMLCMIACQRFLGYVPPTGRANTLTICPLPGLNLSRKNSTHSLPTQMCGQKRLLFSIMMKMTACLITYPRRLPPTVHPGNMLINGLLGRAFACLASLFPHGQ